MTVKPWKTIAKKQIYRHRLYNVVEENVELPNGVTIPDFFIIETGHSCLVVALTNKKEVILNYQYRQGVQKVMLDAPGGVVDPGEDAEAGAKRELLEETGYQAGSIQHIGTIHNEAMTMRHVKSVFLALDCTKVQDQHGDEAEEIETKLVPWTELGELIKNNEIEDSATLAALVLAMQHIN